MPMKVTLLFHNTTTKQSGAPGRIGGWSESYVTDLEFNAGTELGNAVTNLMNARCAMLAKNCGLVGYRYQSFVIDGPKVQPGAVQSFAWSQNGTWNKWNDHPNTALAVRARTSDSLNSRQFVFNGIPDDCTWRGEFYNDTNYAALIVTLTSLLAQGPWKLLCINKANPIRDVIGYVPDNFNTLRTAVPHGFIVGDTIEMNRMKDEWGNAAKGKYKVSAVTADTVKIENGPFSDRNRATPAGGLRKVAMVLKALRFSEQIATNPKLVTRKVGAPFDQFVGRS